MCAVEAHSEVQTPKVAWQIWAGKPDENQPEMLIYDDACKVSQAQLDYALEPIMDRTTLDKIHGSLPEPLLKSAEKLWLQWPDTSYTFYRSVPRLRSIEILRDMDWQEFVDNHVVQFLHDDISLKDSRLVLVHKIALPKGLSPYIAPHGIECTGGGAGKSDFFFHAGHNFGKVTTNSFLGYAKSPTEIHPGSINGKQLPVGIDQVESQSAHQIFSYMFNALERGEDFVSSGGVTFPVRMNCNVNLLANPTSTGERVDAAKSFRYLLYHLSINSMLGRRFGIILYVTDLNKIKAKPSQKELAQWDKDILLFRAVEEFCADKLHTIIESEKVRAWLNSPIRDYEQQVEASANTIEDQNVRAFLNEHGMGAQSRVRGGALYATLVDLLREIALGEATEDMILEHADDTLSEIVNLNIQSIQNIAANWTVENRDYAKNYFVNLPAYMREILSAIELWHRQYPESGEVGIEQIPYQPLDPVYTHLSKCVGKLKKRTPKGKGDTIREIATHYKFQLQEIPQNGWMVTFLDSAPNPTIEPLGKLINLFSPISPISPVHQPSREREVDNDSKLDNSVKTPLSKGGETVKTGKTVKEPAPLDRIVQSVHGSLGTEEGRKEARDLLVDLCKNLPSTLSQDDIRFLVTELVGRDFTKDLDQAKRFVQELIDAAKLGGGN
jgi:demethoxyubiquinone hydroxylase (CLK1/Coq7/Cat5 family)